MAIRGNDEVDAQRTRSCHEVRGSVALGGHHEHDERSASGEWARVRIIGWFPNNLQVRSHAN